MVNWYTLKRVLWYFEEVGVLCLNFLLCECWAYCNTFYFSIVQIQRVFSVLARFYSILEEQRVYIAAADTHRFLFSLFLSHAVRVVSVAMWYFEEGGVVL